ncbi:Glycosyl transferase family 2 [Duganella sp. CF402]|uniref:glycosyltransferase family A protein n=1 Tax=unclassified Duganella TaxID=2636909 RepID=UPI0008AF83CD|nr:MULTISPECIES: glycosyltransferase family A protein [unclassified Duganella]RZT05392.1 glycosyl transferase family 2 [Duganella sp. BK701]SEN09363.1 Glycosyl transferase family 2 [Duganella sp. CF402]
MKITTVIPAYKPKYLMELLAALAQQTEAPERIIFSDDSPDQSFIAILESEPVKSVIAHLNVSTIVGPRRGAHANWAHCIQAWDGQTELLHILCDDDIIYPHFYARHRQAHMSGHFSSTISRRWYANETGQPVRHSLNLPEAVDNHPQRLISLDANALFVSTVGRAANWLGEVSNTVMRADVAEVIVKREVDGIAISGLEDLGAFICGAHAHPLCFINEHLGFFRQSANQNSAVSTSGAMKCAIMSYLGLALIGLRRGLINEEQAQYCFNAVGSNVLWHYRDEADTAAIRAVLPALMAGAPGADAPFLAAWHDFVAAHGLF